MENNLEKCDVLELPSPDWLHSRVDQGEHTLSAGAMAQSDYVCFFFP